MSPQQEQEVALGQSESHKVQTGSPLARLRPLTAEDFQEFEFAWPEEADLMENTQETGDPCCCEEKDGPVASQRNILNKG